ncbi:hypothetical protein MRB53_016693 [Persea americana]|uniref:Uncharacterized protein n=1 Tax=Persea americana TaxID=3435 RepID=A0ACC2M2T2_PERAE|nr:hypothetical protein MRB53_016693 [Persea americana]
MSWNGNFTIFYDNKPCPEHKCHSRRVPLPTVMASSSNSGIPFPVQERKRRLSMDQIDSLERSFQEETKLEPERKMKLAQELCLQPRQVAVWFQNRRARWKAKQLERVYYALKQEFDAISRERQKLQEEVVKLKAELRERAAAAATKQWSATGHTDSASVEETVESAIHIHSTGKNNKNNNSNCSSNIDTKLSYQQIGECNYLLNVEDCNSSLPSYWGPLTGYP